MARLVESCLLCGHSIRGEWQGDTSAHGRCPAGHWKERETIVENYGSIKEYLYGDEPNVLHVVRQGDVEGSLVKLLMHRLHGSVSFTEHDLKRTEQLQVEVRWDGHRYTLTSRWP